jgi:hypothetical protein
MPLQLVFPLQLPAATSIFRLALIVALATACGVGCRAEEPQYGVERRLRLPGEAQQVWAVAPAVNMSGQSGVDPLLHADLVFKQLQSVRGIRAIPVNRTAEAYASLRIDRIETPEQAQLVCELLGCDGLIVPTVTLFDPYDPPKMAAALQLFSRDGSLLRATGRLGMDDVQAIARSPRDDLTLPPPEAIGGEFLQEAGVFDASHGSTRDALGIYATGRNDPKGPAAGIRAYLLSMDLYAGFVYHELLHNLMLSLKEHSAATAAGSVR